MCEQDSNSELGGSVLTHSVAARSHTTQNGGMQGMPKRAYCIDWLCTTPVQSSPPACPDPNLWLCTKPVQSPPPACPGAQPLALHTNLFNSHHQPARGPTLGFAQLLTRLLAGTTQGALKLSRLPAFQAQRLPKCTLQHSLGCLSL